MMEDPGNTTSTASRSASPTSVSSNLDAEGKLITESLNDYTRQRVRETYPNANDFIRHWRDADRKGDLIADLADRGRADRAPPRRCWLGNGYVRLDLPRSL